MKIYDSNTGGVNSSGTQRTQETQQAERGQSGRTSALAGEGDRVEFSGSLGRLSQTLSGFQSGRVSLVAALAAQYQSGNYHPNSAFTSRAMVSEALGAFAETGLQ